MKYATRILFILFLLIEFPLLAQQTVVSGKVTDSETGDGMPFVNVYFAGTTIGGTTDFDGYFSVSTTEPVDSLIASYIGYLARAKPIERGKTQSLSFQLKPDATTLAEVEVVFGEYENPAWEILRKIVENKDKNDKRRLEAYQHESYTKIEVDVDNITDKFKKKKIVNKIITLIDSIEHIAGEDGNPILPVFISESLSDFYYIKNPQRKRENIKKSKVVGIGVTDGSTVSQILGSSFQEYNFYINWLSIVEKDFVSPIADSWKAFYDYELVKEDELVNGIPCYQIKFTPKRPEDLAFSGTMWIADSTNAYAIKQIDVTVGKSANLNFVEKIKIQQEYTPVEDNGAWLPNKTRVLIDIGEVRNDWAGMLAKFYVSNKDFVVNQPKDVKFFEEELVLEEDALVGNGEEFWADHRHDSLTATEKHVYHMIDTVKKLPVVKTYVELANILINGYKKIGKIEIGPYSYAYANNDYEGHRFRLGFKTNVDFSRKFIFRGYAAYGTNDQDWKYSLQGNYIISRKPWTEFGMSRSVELEQVGIYSDDFSNTVLFNASARWGTLRRPFKNEMNKAWFVTEILPNVRTGLIFRNRDVIPQYAFQYFQPGEDLIRQSSFSVSELGIELRIAVGEKFIQNDNDRISLGTSKPVFTLRYTKGFDNLMGGDFSYQKYWASLDHHFRLGTIGRTNYNLSGGYIPSTLPYLLLETHLGNQSFFFNENSYNLMDYFEFVSDSYAHLKVTHRFEGIIMNRIPLFRKLKWRLLGTANLLYGSVRQDNLDIIPDYLDDGETFIPKFDALGDEPYMEVGYGVENIFKFIRVDFIHRLTYLDNGANNFGVKLSAQFRL